MSSAGAGRIDFSALWPEWFVNEHEANQQRRWEAVNGRGQLRHRDVTGLGDPMHVSSFNTAPPTLHAPGHESTAPISGRGEKAGGRVAAVGDQLKDNSVVLVEARPGRGASSSTSWSWSSTSPPPPIPPATDSPGLPDRASTADASSAAPVARSARSVMTPEQSQRRRFQQQRARRARAQRAQSYDD